MSFQSTADAVIKPKAGYVRIFFCDLLSILEPDIRNIPGAAALTLQLRLGTGLIYSYFGHLHLQSWTSEKSPKITLVFIKK